MVEIHLLCIQFPDIIAPHRTQILKVLPSLQQLDSQDNKRARALKLHDAVTSSEVYRLCRRQLSEQDGMRERHRQELEGSEEAASCPERIAQLCNLRVCIVL